MPELVHMDEDTLTHYGRLGMKWGQHIFGRGHAVHKTLRKLSKMENKVYKTSEKAYKNYKKARTYASVGNGTAVVTNPKYEKKFKKYDAKFNKQYARAQKFVENANKILGKGGISNLSAKDMALAVALGERFTLDFAKLEKKGG